MRRNVADFGTGNYPNNVANYLLNSSPVYRVYIPKDYVELRRLWRRVEECLPVSTKKGLQLVFDEKHTYKEAAMSLGVSNTTLRNYIMRIPSRTNSAGYILQPIFSWAVGKGYVKELTLDTMLEVRDEIKSYSEQLSSKQVKRMYELFQCGRSVKETSQIMVMPYNVVVEFYSTCLDKAGVKETLDGDGV